MLLGGPRETGTSFANEEDDDTMGEDHLSIFALTDICILSYTLSIYQKRPVK